MTIVGVLFVTLPRACITGSFVFFTRVLTFSHALRFFGIANSWFSCVYECETRILKPVHEVVIRTCKLEEIAFVIFGRRCVYKKVSYRKQIARQHSCRKKNSARADDVVDPVKCSFYLVWSPCKKRLLFLVLSARVQKVPELCGTLEPRPLWWEVTP